MPAGPPAEAPLSVAFVIARYPPALGGTETQAGLLAAALRERGHRVTVLTQRLPGPPPSDSPDVVRLPPVVGGRAASALFGVRLAAALDRLRPGLVQAFLLSSPALFACLAGRRLGCPVAVRTGGSGEDCDLATSRRRLSSRVRLALVLRLADHLVAPSQAAADEARGAGFPAGRCSVIPNGVDTGRFQHAPREAASPAARTVLFAGRLERQKDPETLLRAWREVALTRPGARLVLLGDGSLRPTLEGLARELGVSASVEFAGTVAREELPGRYGSAGIFVLPSRSEGMSNALLEALASGLAPVVTDLPDCRDVFPGGRGALLFAPGDSAALAAHLSRLLDDPGLREAMSRDAAALGERFSIGRAADSYLELYRALRGRRRGAAA